MTAVTDVAEVLSRDERWSYEQQCDAVLCEAIAALGTYDGIMDPAEWELVLRRDELNVHRAVRGPEDEDDDDDDDDDDSQGADEEEEEEEEAGVDDDDELSAPRPRPRQRARRWRRLMGTGYIRGRCADVTRGLYCDSDASLISVETVLGGTPVLGGAVLQCTERASERTPFRFAGVKWLAVACAGEARDLLTYERMGMTLDTDSTEVAYHIVHAIPDHDDWPYALPVMAEALALGAIPRGLRRVEAFTICYLYRKVTEDLVQVYITGDYAVSRGPGPGHGHGRGQGLDEMESILMERIFMVAGTVASGEAKTLTRLVRASEGTPPQLGRTCRRCRHRRAIKDEHLRGCGICRKSVCTECRVMKVLCDMDPRTRMVETEAFCHKCLTRAELSLDATDGKVVAWRATRRRQRHHEWKLASARAASSRARHRERRGASHSPSRGRHALPSPSEDEDEEDSDGPDQDPAKSKSKSKSEGRVKRRHKFMPWLKHEHQYDELLARVLGTMAGKGRGGGGGATGSDRGLGSSARGQSEEGSDRSGLTRSGGPMPPFTRPPQHDGYWSADEVVPRSHQPQMQHGHHHYPQVGQQHQLQQPQQQQEPRQPHPSQLPQRRHRSQPPQPQREPSSEDDLVEFTWEMKTMRMGAGVPVDDWGLTKQTSKPRPRRRANHRDGAHGNGTSHEMDSHDDLYMTDSNERNADADLRYEKYLARRRELDDRALDWAVDTKKSTGSSTSSSGASERMAPTPRAGSPLDSPSLPRRVLTRRQTHEPTQTTAPTASQHRTEFNDDVYCV